MGENLQDKIHDFLNKLKKINCGCYKCENCYSDDEDWPDCKLGDQTSPKNGYIRVIGSKKIDCPFYKSKDGE